MLLSELIQSVPLRSPFSGSDTEIQGLYCDSRMVQPGGLFFALKGVSADGHRFIGMAIERGAAAVVLEDADFMTPVVPCLRVEDSRRAMAVMATVFYGAPTAKIPLVGITGTNGKTTTSYIIEGILESAGIPAAVLGTVSYRLGATEIAAATHTTPESTELQAVMRRMVEQGAKGIVMEVSSHALEQHRVDGCFFDVGVFTNLTRDHLDYHGDMNSYFMAKARLFRELLIPDDLKPRRRSVVNMDDAYGADVASASVCPVITYGVDFEGDVRVRDVMFSVNGIEGHLVTPDGDTPFSSRLVGRFNLSNILAAAAAGYALGVPAETLRKGIESHRKVPGRLERVDNGREITVLVDYAHTGDALENVLRTLTALKTGRLITLFGCGGDRDSGKRPIMGEVAGRYSDLSVITSDNPRTEGPLAIISQIREGIVPLGLREYHCDELAASRFPEKGFVVIPDRREAIRLAIGLACKGDIVLLAGKGHEDYQIIGTTKHHFDDREEAAAALASMGAV